MMLAQKILRRFREDGVQGLVTAVANRLNPPPAPVDENGVIVGLFPEEKGVMLDVGAAHGATLLPLAKRGWDVHAFEPDTKNRAKLLETVSGLSNVTVNALAVTEADDQILTFYSSPVSFGVSSLSAFTADHVASETVRTVRLDTYLAQHDITTVDYLKIDAEGHDLFVLKSFPFSRVKPRAILCEFENAKSRPLGYDVNAMAEFLVAQGYAVIVSEWHPIERYGVAHKWLRFASYPVETNEAGWGNLMALRDPAMADTARRLCGIDAA